MNCSQRSFTHLIHVTVLIVSFAFTSCASIDMHKVVRGYWETVEGQLGSSPETEIYTHDWYAIDLIGDSSAGVTWDDGISCTRTEGSIVGNEIHLTAHEVETTFVFHDATHATVTFHRGQTTYVKQLKKTRDDPTPACA